MPKHTLIVPPTLPHTVPDDASPIGGHAGVSPGPVADPVADPVAAPVADPVTGPVADLVSHLTPGLVAMFVALLGRGGTGKTFLLRWLAERAIGAGRTVFVADGDRTNRSLSHYFDDVFALQSADHLVALRWLEDLVERLIRERFTLLVDLGGGDMLLKQLAHEVGGLNAFLEERGAVPLALHLLGPSVESLGVLAALEDEHSPLFAPARTVLILNEGLVPPGLDPAAAFEPVREHPVFIRALRRGAQAVVMPELRPAHDIARRRLSFAAAAAGQTGQNLPPLGLVDRQRVTMWRRAMETVFAPVAAWLP